VFEALAEKGVTAEAVVYADAVAEEVREQLSVLDGVLVWVDPISGDGDRTQLDALLRDVASAGVWVSAHPETIQRIGTKEVLYRTRHLGWGTDTHLYSTFEQFTEEFPARLALGRPRVLKQNRGNGGMGVWKVETAGSERSERLAGSPVQVRVQHAAPRDAATEVMTIDVFMHRCREYFTTSTGKLIDQAFAVRLPDGMIRAYLVQDEVVGFAGQQPAMPSDDADVPRPDKVFGLPSAKTMYGPDEPRFAVLTSKLEQEWIPAMQDAVGIDRPSLPLLWDADFLYGPRTESGDSYILCEINVSSVSPFPPQAVERLASAVFARCTTNRHPRTR
jgi:hypothetical protein